jgi:hypothetical protein
MIRDQKHPETLLAIREAVERLLKASPASEQTYAHAGVD